MEATTGQNLARQRTDIAYVATHGFAARMIMQTNLLGQLVDSGLQVALIAPDATDSALAQYCTENSVDLYEFSPPQNGKLDEFARARRYLLDDIRKNPALLERHRKAMHATSVSLASWLRPRLYMLGYRLNKILPQLGEWFGRQEKRLLANPTADELLAHIAPRIFVSTYPVNYGEAMLQLAAQKQTDCLSVIHLLSWDNISCKGTFVATADHYLLWGKVMGDELREYYNVPDNQVTLTGVPHFDTHVKNRGVADTSDDLRKLGLAGELPYLFFGMSASHFAPGELDIIEWLAEQIRADVFGPDLQLVVRPHPQNLKGNMSEASWLPRLEKLAGNRVGVDFPQLVDSRMSWSMQRGDMDRLSRLIAGSKVVYNSGSTISIDALMCDVPVVLTSFDGGLKDIAAHESAGRLIFYSHLAKLVDTEAVEVCRTFAELMAATRCFLKQPEKGLHQRQVTIRDYCANYDHGDATIEVGTALRRLLT